MSNCFVDMNQMEDSIQPLPCKWLKCWVAFGSGEFANKIIFLTYFDWVCISIAPATNPHYIYVFKEHAFVHRPVCNVMSNNDTKSSLICPYKYACVMLYPTKKELCLLQCIVLTYSRFEISYTLPPKNTLTAPFHMM